MKTIKKVLLVVIILLPSISFSQNSYEESNDVNYCDKIEVIVDNFEDRKTHISPYVSGFKIIKLVKNGDTHYYLRVDVPGSIVSVGKKGLYILFEDGTKISKPNAEIHIEVGSGDYYTYSAFIMLAQEDIEILTTKKITDHRLYIYDGKVSSEESDIIIKYAKCIFDN